MLAAARGGRRSSWRSGSASRCVASTPFRGHVALAQQHAASRLDVAARVSFLQHVNVRG